LGVAATLATTPVPFRVVVCGVPGASSATFSVAVLAPVAPGVNVTLTMQDPPFAVSTKLATQVVPLAMAKSPGFVPVNVTGVPEASVATDPPVFVTVTVEAALVVATFWFPKGTGLGATITLATTPVPFSVVVCGLPGASSATFSVAVLAPTAPGVNVTLTMQDPPFAVSTKLATQVVPLAMAKSPGFVPVNVTGVPAVSVAASVPEFVTVIVDAALVVATF
jgi:hypothetical protein